mgnify:CR=1 FL=1
MEKLNVAIADDNEKMVEVLGQIIEEDKDLGQAHNGEEICNIIRKGTGRCGSGYYYAENGRTGSNGEICQ